MKILLADDDADQLEIRCLLLQKSGFETIAATSHAQALKDASAQSPECAVIDLCFPTEQAGLSLIRGLKALNAAMHVFVLTGLDAKRLDHLPEKDLVSGIITKGNGASASLVKLLNSLLKSGYDKLRERLQNESALIVDVKVITRSLRSEVVEARSDGFMKVKLVSVPQKGNANQELIDVLAAFFSIRKDQIELLSGDTSPRKRLRIVR